MNIELDEVVVQDVSDDALEQAAGGAQGGRLYTGCYCSSAHCFAATACLQGGRLRLCRGGGAR